MRKFGLHKAFLTFPHVSNVHSLNTNKNQWRLKEPWPYIHLAFHLRKRKKPEALHAHSQTRALIQHPGSGLLYISSRGMKLPPGAWPAYPGHIVLVFVCAVSAEQWISAIKYHAWLLTRLLWAQTKSLDPNPLQLWGVWNLDPDLKLVVGPPSLGFQLGVQFINTSATTFFCSTPPWIRSYCYEIKLDLTTGGNITLLTSHTFSLSHFQV